MIIITTLNESSSSSSYFRFQLKKSMFTLSKDRLVDTMIVVVEKECLEGVLMAGTH